TSNYAFLNYLVLLLGILLLDDEFLARVAPSTARTFGRAQSSSIALKEREQLGWKPAIRLGVQGFFLTWVGYATLILLLSMLTQSVPLPELPARALEPFRIANDFGLF